MYILILLSLSPLASIANEFKIYRTGYQHKFDDVFMTSQSVCNTSTLSCHDYNAAQVTCNECSCARGNGTFGYLNGWQCFGAKDLRRDTGCFVLVLKSGQKAGPLDSLHVVTTDEYFRLNLSLYSECTYRYSENTYYRKCDGLWSAVGSFGSSRYELITNKKQEQGKPDRFKYWIHVKPDLQTSRNFEGRIMKINLKCKKRGVKPWNECLVFKEKYLSKPILCPKSLPTVIPSMKSTTLTRQNTTSSPTLNSTSSIITEELPKKLNTSSTEMSTNKTDEGAGIHKNVILGVSAAGGLLLVSLVIIICIICYKRRQRRDISKYGAALYESSQGQSSSGIYADICIQLPSTSKSPRLTSHSNPSYERGRDFSIKIADSQKQTINPSSSTRLGFTNESFENDISTVTSKAPESHPPPVKQRRNMLVKYENVTILSDLRPESVPDAERFYDNQGVSPPQYHVLEKPTEGAPSYGEYPPRLNPDNSTRNDYESTEDFTNDYDNDMSDDASHDVIYDFADEPIYANSPAIVANETRGNKFPFEVSDELEDGILNEMNYDNNENNGDIYANSEAVRNSLSENQSAQNTACSDDEDDDDTSRGNEPIYDNALIMTNTSNPGGSPLVINQSHQVIYQDLRSAQVQESDYQSLTPVTSRRNTDIPKPTPSHQ